MGLFSFLKRKQTPPKSAGSDELKADIINSIFSQMAEQSPSRHFVAGTVFDVVRLNHDRFAAAVTTCDMRFLKMLFISAYTEYLNNPSAFGGIPNIVNKEKNDTNPMSWNMNVQRLANGDTAFLCFMPIQNDTLMARIFGIILGSRGDGYYYCMLNKNQNQPSDVIRNKAMAGIETVGAVSGLGFELMNNFLGCITNNYYA